MGGAGRERGLDLVEAVDLDDDPVDAGRDGAAHRLADAAGDRDMIVLDHRRVPQAHAVVLRAAHPGRIFLEHAQAGDGLAGVEQDRAGAGDRVDIAPGQRGDAGEMLDGVERRALGGEHRARLAAAGAADVAGPDAVAVLDAAARSRPRDRARGRRPRRSAGRRRRSPRGCPSRRRSARSAGITAAEVMSPPSPRSSASVAATKRSRSKRSRREGHGLPLRRNHPACHAGTVTVTAGSARPDSRRTLSSSIASAREGPAGCSSNREQPAST